MFAIRRRVKVAATSVLRLPVTSVRCRSASFPHKRNYFNLPGLFDLLWPFSAEAASKRRWQLKSSISASLAFILLPSSPSLTRSLPQYVLLNSFSLADQKRKQKIKLFHPRIAELFQNGFVHNRKRGSTAAWRLGLWASG